METGLVLLFALIYVLANRFLAPFFYSKEKLNQYRKQYLETYQELLKAGISASQEELEKKQQQLLEISKLQMKESFKAMMFTLALFLILYAAIDFFYPVEYTPQPTSNICLAISEGHFYMYENGTLKTIEFIPFFEPKTVNVSVEKYDCNEAVVYLPFPIGNIQYVYGYKKIFILYVIVLSLVVAVVEQIYKKLLSKDKNEGP